MRFDRLHIRAFGPFTDLDLEFPLQNNDFQVIRGANEAGKSSLLRACRDLLFGIHGQSADNFIHDYKRLRIGGEIVNSGGQRLVFQRRKGNKNTLLDANGGELPESALAPFLGSVDKEYFSTMFGLGTRELREGAEQLLVGKGNIGNALFSASMGGAPVQLVLAALVEEADRLFKGRSSANVSIRPTLKEYKELLVKSRDAIVTPESWDNVQKELAVADESKRRLEGDIAAAARDLEWISRCEDALPTVGRLNEEMRKQESLPPLPVVASDFVVRARDARAAVGQTRGDVEHLSAQIAKLEGLLAECRFSSAVLAEAETLESLHQELGAYRERKKSLRDLEPELTVLEADLRTGMQNLGLTGDFSVLETLRLSSAVRLACEEAADELQNAQKGRDESLRKTEELKVQIKNLEAQLLTLPETDLTALRDALSVAAVATEANRTIAASEAEVRRLTIEVSELYNNLAVAFVAPGAPVSLYPPLAEGVSSTSVSDAKLDSMGRLPVPSKAAIRLLGAEQEEINRNIKSEDLKIIENKEKVKLLQGELGRLERLGELPSEQTLHKIREHRDHGWRLVLAEWKGAGSDEEFVPGLPLEEAFPQSIIQADGIADQLRRQAEAVAQAEEKRFQIARTKEQLAEAENKIADFQRKLREWQISWEKGWLPCGITPRLPNEMEEWRESWSHFREILRQLRTAGEVLQYKVEQVGESRIQLAAVLADSADKGFALLFDKARRRVQDGEQTSGRRIQAANQIQALRGSLETLEQNNGRLAAVLEAATKKWEERRLLVGLPPGVSPSSGPALLQERKEIIAKFDNFKKLLAKTEMMREAVSHYELAVSQKAATLGAAGDTTETREGDLWKSLAKSRAARTRHEQLAGQIEEAKETLRESRSSYERALQGLTELLCLARLETVEELEPLLASLELRDAIAGRIAAFRDTLGGLARGGTVDDFLARVGSEDIDSLPRRKELLGSGKLASEGALRTLGESLYELQQRKKALENAGDDSANYRQQAESCAARLREDASRFIRLRMAVHLLRAQIERFRKENQGPLLEKSSLVFQAITGGAFSGLGAEFSADDLPLLVGLRPDRTAVPIEGMSDGSRDQLFLALRLAALDQYLENHEPMPLILDDLLITCDDGRAAAIIPQLALLARRTQIFLFTHHDHIVELCRATLGEDYFHLHNLNSPGGIKKHTTEEGESANG